MDDIFIDKKIEKERFLTGNYVGREGFSTGMENTDNATNKCI